MNYRGLEKGESTGSTQKIYQDILNMKTKNIKIIQKILNNEKTQKIINKNINNVLKKLKN